MGEAMREASRRTDKGRLFTYVSMILLAAVVLLLIVGLSPGDRQKFVYDFSEGDHGWVPGWVDMPVDHDPVFYGLESNWTFLPESVGDSKSMFISSDNHADDIFMFFRKQIEGLEPDTEYAVTFEIELASKYPEGSFGIGGSPADSVYLKGGAAADEPVAIVDEDDWLRLNLDKGGQSQGGEDAVVLGTIAKPDDGTDEYVLIDRDNSGSPLLTKSDENGRVWVFFGTDSAFEGTTALYYARVRITVNAK